MKVGIIGAGVVGSATAKAYKTWADEIRVYDKIVEKSVNTLKQVLECDVVFICLPTPQDVSVTGEELYELDCSAVELFCSELKGYEGLLVLRSTVPIGLTRQLKNWYGLPGLLHSPEFLSARTADNDAEFPTRLIVGGDAGEKRDLLVRIYKDRFPEVPILVMSSDESEAVKLISNSYAAVKVSFFNEMRMLTDKLGLGWENIREGFLTGGFINRPHTQVPGYHGFGFAGNCLIKDLACMIGLQVREGLSANVCFAADYRNKVYDRSHRG